MKICFLLSSFSRSGGVNAVLQHARWLHADHGHEITLALHDDVMPHDDFGAAEFAEIVLFKDLDAGSTFDIALATYWETAFWIFDVPARRHAHFLQSFEDRFFPARTPKRTLARMSLGLPLTVVTEASWIADTVRAVQPAKQVELVRNGIDKDVFTALEAVPADHGGPLRIVVEGHPGVWFKSIPETIEVLRALNEPFEAVFVVPEPENIQPQIEGIGRAEGPLTPKQLAERYRWADVIVKLSRVEGMFGPPLEAFHLGTTCVVWPVTGHDEYIRHAENGVVTDWDDISGTARWIDLLARDRELLDRFKRAALQTAQQWPSWREAAGRMNAALSAVAAEPVSVDPAQIAQLSETLRASMGALDRYASTMGLMAGSWPAAEERARELELEVERMGGRKKVRAIRRAKQIYRRVRPVPVDHGPT